VHELTSPRLDWPRDALLANCPVSNRGQTLPLSRWIHSMQTWKSLHKERSCVCVCVWQNPSYIQYGHRIWNTTAVYISVKSVITVGEYGRQIAHDTPHPSFRQKRPQKLRLNKAPLCAPFCSAAQQNLNRQTDKNLPWNTEFSAGALGVKINTGQRTELVTERQKTATSTQKTTVVFFWRHFSWHPVSHRRNNRKKVLWAKNMDSRAAA